MDAIVKCEFKCTVTDRCVSVLLLFQLFVKLLLLYCIFNFPEIEENGEYGGTYRPNYVTFP